MVKTNPLHHDALTADTVKTDDRIVVYVPQIAASAQRYVVLNSPYLDNDDDMVIDLRREDGQVVTLLTSEAGLSGGRFDGIWTHVAVINDES